MPETKQIQSWLSCTGEKRIAVEEQVPLKKKFCSQVKAYIALPVSGIIPMAAGGKFTAAAGCLDDAVHADLVAMQRNARGDNDQLGEQGRQQPFASSHRTPDGAYRVVRIHPKAGTVLPRGNDPDVRRSRGDMHEPVS